MAHMCIIGPDISGLQATSSYSHLCTSSSPSSSSASSSSSSSVSVTASSSACHSLVSVPPPLCNKDRNLEVSRSSSSPLLPALSSSTLLPRVSTSSSHGQSRRRNYGPKQSQRPASCKAAKLKTMEQLKVFQPPLGWPFSDASKELICVQKHEEREIEDAHVEVDTVCGEPSSSTEEGMYRSLIVQSERNGNYFLPILTVQSSPPPRQKQESSEGENFYVNCGSAIRALREELPSLFYKDLSYDIYREDITFTAPMTTLAGIDNYKTLFWALRFHSRIFFKALWVDVVRVWQPSDKVIMIRWTVRGIPRVPWEAQGRFDGTSEYKLDKDGKIYEHKVDNVIMNSPPRFKARTVMDLVREAAGQTTPTPSFYQKTGVFFTLLAPYLLQFTWVRFYWALRSTLVLTTSGDSCSEMVPTPQS